MSVALATDLVMDVVKAAAPAVSEQARELLQMAAGKRAELSAKTDAFATQVASLDNFLPSSADLSGLRDRLASKLETETATRNGDIPDSYKNFEAMVLGQFIGEMLPKDNEEVFGKGTAGEIWRSMLGEKIGNVIADSGGIGIAERMAERARQKHVPAGELSQNTVNEAVSMSNKLQMSFMSDLLGLKTTVNSENKG